MVDALRRAHGWLKAAGSLVDIRPTAEPAYLEVQLASGVVVAGRVSDVSDRPARTRGMPAPTPRWRWRWSAAGSCRSCVWNSRSTATPSASPRCAITCAATGSAQHRRRSAGASNAPASQRTRRAPPHPRTNRDRTPPTHPCVNPHDGTMLQCASPPAPCTSAPSACTLHERPVRPTSAPGTATRRTPAPSPRRRDGAIAPGRRVRIPRGRR